MGDRLPADNAAAAASSADMAKVEAAIDTAFADPAARTAGVVVVHKGRLIAERYMPGITQDTQLESWSMGKSITSTLFALLVKDGTYTLEQRAPVDSWQRPGDPRAAIRNIDLLRMSSGLRFIATQDGDYTPDKGYPDHFYVYTGAVNAFEYSVSVPLQFPVNTEGRYRNSDPLTIGMLIKQAVSKRGEEYLTWPQRALFDKIGIRRQVLETDPFGNFLLTGYDYGTPRNWARLGLLYLQDGIWQGQQLLPEGWAKFVSTPAPAWKTPTMAAFSGSMAPDNGTCPRTPISWRAPAANGRSWFPRTTSSWCGWATTAAPGRVSVRSTQRSCSCCRRFRERAPGLGIRFQRSGRSGIRPSSQESASRVSR